MSSKQTTQTNGAAPLSAPAGQAPVTPAPSVNVYTESPASMNIKFIYRGADLMITLREGNGTALLDKLPAVMDRIEAMGGILKTARGGGQAANDAQASEAPVCEFHGPMARSTRFAGWYCKKKMGNGSYCKSEVRD